MHFERWYKQWIEGNAESPPEKVWEEIQDSLDIDLVWHQVSGGLDRSAKKRKPLYWVVAASFLLLIGSAGLITYFFPVTFLPTHVTDVQPVLHRTVPDDMPSILGRETALPARGPTPLSLNVRASFPVQGLRPGYPFESAPTGLPYITAATGEAFPVTTPTMDSETGIHPIIKISAKEQTGINLAYVPGSEKPQQSGYFAGISAQLANTWVRNEKTSAGLQSGSLTDTRPSFGNSIGLIAGRTISENLVLHVGFDIISQKRQAYNEYLRGQYVATSLEMDYTKLSFMAGYKLHADLPHWTFFGVYAGYLQNAKSNINGWAEPVSENFTTMDYGVIAGYEYYHSLGGHWQLGTGIFANYGLTNIYTGDGLIPVHLNKTKLLSFQLGISLRYSVF